MRGDIIDISFGLRRCHHCVRIATAFGFDSRFVNCHRIVADDCRVQLRKSAAVAGCLSRSDIACVLLFSPFQLLKDIRWYSSAASLEIVINGGINSLDAVEGHLKHVDGVMLGRAAYQTPWLLAECQQRLFGELTLSRREDIIEPMSLYLERLVKNGTAVKHASRHLLGLFQGRPGARAPEHRARALCRPSRPGVGARGVHAGVHRPAGVAVPVARAGGHQPHGHDRAGGAPQSVRLAHLVLAVDAARLSA